MDNKIHFSRLLNPNIFNTIREIIITMVSLSMKVNIIIGLNNIVETQSIAFIIILDSVPIVSIASTVPSLNEFIWLGSSDIF